MLSNHYPLAFGTEYAWIIACLVFLMGVTIRHFFNSMHARKGMPYWTWAVTIILMLVIAWLSAASTPETYEEAEARPLTPYEQTYASAKGFEAAYDVVLGNCSMCHAREPVWDGMYWAPKGVFLETQSDVARHAKEIFLQAGVSHAMPPPSASYTMDDEGRAAIVAWYRAADR
jgi:uncharacterized membrane protein